jgi:hypothetical protein
MLGFAFTGLKVTRCCAEKKPVATKRSLLGSRLPCRKHLPKNGDEFFDWKLTQVFGSALPVHNASYLA